MDIWPFWEIIDFDKKWIFKKMDVWKKWIFKKGGYLKKVDISKKVDIWKKWIFEKSGYFGKSEYFEKKWIFDHEKPGIFDLRSKIIDRPLLTSPSNFDLKLNVHLRPHL